MKRKRDKGRRRQVTVQTRPTRLRQWLALVLYRNGWTVGLRLTVGKIRYGIGGKWHKVSLGQALGVK
jgi:hypothetical protein